MTAKKITPADPKATAPPRPRRRPTRTRPPTARPHSIHCGGRKSGRKTSGAHDGG